MLVMEFAPEQSMYRAGERWARLWHFCITSLMVRPAPTPHRRLRALTVRLWQPTYSRGLLWLGG